MLKRDDGESDCEHNTVAAVSVACLGRTWVTVSLALVSHVCYTINPCLVLFNYNCQQEITNSDSYSPDYLHFSERHVCAVRKSESILVPVIHSIYGENIIIMITSSIMRKLGSRLLGVSPLLQTISCALTVSRQQAPYESNSATVLKDPE